LKFLCMLGFCDSAVSIAGSPDFADDDVAFPSPPRGRHTGGMISELNSPPAHTPAVAPPTTLPSSGYDSGPERLASPAVSNWAPMKSEN
jgi:hypothetical protein